MNKSEYAWAAYKVRLEELLRRLFERADRIRELEIELAIARDKLEHAERKLAGEWPYDGISA